MSQTDFDAVFYPGGHGPMWDLAEHKHSEALIESFIAAEKPIALVCHAPAALRRVKTATGVPLVSGRKVTGFANTEEAAMELTDVVPFLLEDELRKLGGIYSKGEDLAEYVVMDGLLITGQNPKSSAAAVLLVERVCFAQKFSLTSSSSSELLASLNKADVKACSDDASAKKLADAISTSKTVGDLIAALKSPLASVPVGFTACTNATGLVELDSPFPQAIALKTWRIYQCVGKMQSNMCRDHKNDPNQLEYDEESRPELI